VLFYPCFILKEVSLVIRGVWVFKTLASPGSLSRKLLKEASREKLLKEAVWSCLGQSAILH